MVQIQPLANIGDLGLASSRPMHLQYAVSYVLKQAADVTPFPGKHVEIPAERFDDLVRQIVAKANGENPAGWQTFQEAEAARDLTYRGYDRGMLTVEPIQVIRTPVDTVTFPLAPVLQISIPPPTPVLPLPPPPPVTPPPADYKILPVPGPPAVEMPPPPDEKDWITFPVGIRPADQIPVEPPPPGAAGKFDKKWLIVAALAALVLMR